jgi:tetratricopeptide (TPR) repeat protein
LLSWFVALALLLPGPLWAAELEASVIKSANDLRAAGREHFNKGANYFKLGRFDEAISEYEAAYEISALPQILYPIARSNHLAGHRKEAIFFYKQFLRLVPNAPNRKEVEKSIAELMAALSRDRPK